MITYEIVRDCLDILEIKYTDMAEENGEGIGICFYNEDSFPYEIITNIHILNDELLAFASHAENYHPQGDIYEMANRHNTRHYSPRCYIDSDNDVIMHQAFILKEEVSPTFILKDVIHNTLSATIEGFTNFELTNEEIEARNNSNR